MKVASEHVNRRWGLIVRVDWTSRNLKAVKSGSSGLKSDGGSGGEMEVSHRGGPEVQWG